MKCYVIPSPKGIDSLTPAERPDPVPGPRQVLVRVKASSLNYRDLLTIEAQYARSAPKPPVRWCGRGRCGRARHDAREGR